jgi:ectoine hydroxylase-related dioxygenase (phytanoyl-CoA dioxygenase family)
MDTVAKKTVNDLSLHHTVLSTLFRPPKIPSEWDQYRLTEDQLNFYKENGYVSNIPLLSQEQINQLKAELTEITSPTHPGNSLFYYFFANESADPNSVLFHALGAWRITPGFHDVLWNPGFVIAASQLLGDKSVRFWHDQLFCKPAHHGGVVAWHQDYSYWTRTSPMQHLTCWVGLDDADTQNGCLYYVPGSHKWGLLEKPELAGNMNGIFDYLTEEQRKQFKPVPIELKAGYATFHHPLLLHGSYENKSERSRRAFVLNVFADGTISNTSDEPVLEGIPRFNKGKKLDGQYFPLLYDASEKSKR